MTRTVFYKSASEKAKEVFNIVLEANKRAIAMVKPGVRFCDIDNAAREYITEKGYGKYFTHRTGHSIGIETHDMGDVSSINTDILKPGMIFSVEPGIYLPGEFGVRIEDLVLVTEDGHELLNKYNKELIHHLLLLLYQSNVLFHLAYQRLILLFLSYLLYDFLLHKPHFYYFVVYYGNFRLENHLT